MLVLEWSLGFARDMVVSLTVLYIPLDIIIKPFTHYLVVRLLETSK